jgi:hypothetical protein
VDGKGEPASVVNHGTNMETKKLMKTKKKHTTPSAASSKEPERDESDCAPYWLCRGMAQYIVEIYDETCERAAVGGELCHNTSDCITEWCVPCAAKAWLEEQIRLEKPLPPNGAAHRQPPTTNKDKNAK